MIEARPGIGFEAGGDLSSRRAPLAPLTHQAERISADAHSVER